MLRMTHRHGERVGRIARDLAGQLQQRTHHVHDLHLVGTTKAHRGELDRPRRVLGELNGRAERGEGRPTRLTELQRTFDVAIDEDFFDRHFLRSMQDNEIGHTRMDARQPLGERQTVNLDAALRETANLSTVDLDEAVTRAPRSWIEAQNATRTTQGGLGRGDGRPHFSGSRCSRSRCSRSRRSRLKGPPGLRPITRHAFATPENVPENDAGMIPGIG